MSGRAIEGALEYFEARRAPPWIRDYLSVTMLEDESMEFYMHFKGGLYLRLFDAKNSEDMSDVVVYQHLHPHKSLVYIRKAEEFYDPRRFSRITKEWF